MKCKARMKTTCLFPKKGSHPYINYQAKACKIILQVKDSQERITEEALTEMNKRKQISSIK